MKGENKMLTKKQEKFWKIVIILLIVAYIVITSIGSIQNTKSFNNYKDQFIENMFSQEK